MRLMRLPRHLLLLIALLLCPAPYLLGQEASDPGEMARQLASAANDNAISLEDRQESLRKLQESARLFLSVGETVEAARVLNRAGRLQLILHNPQDATASHSQALDLIKQRPEADVEVDALNGLGAAYLSLETKTKEAEETLQKAVSLSKQSGYVPGQAQALLSLSEAQNTYDHHLALQTAQTAFTLWQTLGDKRGLARAYAQIGQYYMAQSMLPESIQNYEQSLGLWRELNNPPGQAEALIGLGFIEHRKGEWSNAISFYTQAQPLLDVRAEPLMMGEIEAGLGGTFNENGLPDNGLIHYQRALDYYQQAQKLDYVADATMRLGITYYLQGNFSEAIAHFQQALTLTRQDITLAAECDEYLGRVYISTVNYELALQHLQSALAIYTRAYNPAEVARVQALMGQIAEQKGQPERARQYYQLALKTFIKVSDPINQAAIYYALGQFELKKRNYDAAEKYLLRSIEVTEDIRLLSKSTDLTAAFSATVYERYEKYIECLMYKHQAQPSQRLDVLAFQTSELARARSLLELLKLTATNLVPSLEPHLAEQEKFLRQSLVAKEDYKIALLNQKDYSVDELKALDKELVRLNAEYKQVIKTIQARYPSYGQITQPVAWDLRRIQEEVIADDQTVLLEYSLGADKSYVWAVTRDTIKSYELPAQAQIDEAVLKVNKMLATSPSIQDANELTTATQELSKLVLLPLATELNRSRIIVVADGALNYIPFQVLLMPSDNNQPLSYEVVNAPSATILGELRQEAARRQPAAKVLAAFGDPVFASNYAFRGGTKSSEQLAVVQAPETDHLQQALRDIELNGNSFDPSTIKPLFYAKRELVNLRNVAGEGETFLASNFDATREQLLNTDLTPYAILHFATHGYFDPKRPEFSGLVLSTINRDGQAQNGFVGLQDIYGLRAPVNLVVLSACQTGLGKDIRGEGLVGLTRGFMYAGASTVVASLWKVEDKATAELMKHFYENMLQKRMTPAAALREAQNTIRQQPGWSSPYYWAAFILQGEYRQVIKSQPAKATSMYPKILVVGSLLALLAIVAWGYRYYRGRRTA